MRDMDQGFNEEDAEQLKLEISRLKEQIASRDMLLAIISHDLRSPMTSIIGLIQLLLSTYVDNLTEKQIHILNTLSRSSQQELTLIESVTKLSRIYRGKLKPKPEEVELRTIITLAIEPYRMIAEEKCINIEVENGACCYLNVDISQVSMALGMLVKNAIWFTNQGGLVSVTVNDAAERLEILVTDNGVGMGPKALDQLFDISSNYFSLGTSDERGSGMGLYTVKALAEMNNGDVYLESELGVGTKAGLVFSNVDR